MYKSLTLLFSTIILFTNSCKQVQTTSPANFKNIEMAEYLEQNQQDAMLIDVRTPEEYADGAIEGSINIDYKNENFKNMIAQFDHSKPYLLYCRSGARSASASQVMIDMGFKNITNIKGGYNSYAELKK